MIMLAYIYILIGVVLSVFSAMNDKSKINSKETSAFVRYSSLIVFTFFWLPIMAGSKIKKMKKQRGERK